MIILILNSILLFSLCRSEIYLNSDAPQNGDGSPGKPFNDFTSALENIVLKVKPIKENLILSGFSPIKIRDSNIVIEGDVEINVYPQASSQQSSLAIDIFPQITITNGAKVFFTDIIISQNLLTPKRNNYISVKNGGLLTMKRVSFTNLTGTFNNFILCSNEGTLSLNEITITYLDAPAETSLFELNYCASLTLISSTFTKNSMRPGSSFLKSINSAISITNIIVTENVYKASSPNNSSESFFFSLSLMRATTLLSCTFKKNSVLIAGGLLYLTASNELTTSDLSFEENVLSAGSLFKASLIKNMKIKSYSVVNNKALIGLSLQNSDILAIEKLTCNNNNYNNLLGCSSDFGGPCLQLLGNAVGTLTDSTFNKLCGSSATAAIIIDQTQADNQLTISKSSFTKNFAYYSQIRQDIIAKGVNIYLRSGLNLLISDCKFQENSADASEGIIKEARSVVLLSENEDASIKITSTEIIQNQALYEGNCITAKGHLLQLENSLIAQNTHYNMSKGFTSGGLISSSVDVLKLLNLVLKKNFASIGGVIHFSSKNPTFQHKAYIDNCDFQENTALFNGVIFFDVLEYQIYVTNSNFSRSSAEKGGVLGGGFVSNTFLFHAINCIFTDNKATNEGGVGHIAHIGGKYIFDNCSFLNNFATKAGLFIYVGTIDAPVIVNNCSFINNRAAVRGGIAAISSGTIKDWGSIYVNNSAGREGGLYVLENNALVQLSNCSVINSSAGYIAGVAILMEENTIALDQNTVIRGSFSKKGACIVANTLSKVKISGITFLENIADKGVILYLSNCAFWSDMSSVVIAHNWALNEGLIQIDNALLQLTNISLQENSANAVSISFSQVNINGLYSTNQYCGSEIRTFGCIVNVKGNTNLNLLDFKVQSIKATGSKSIVSISTGAVSVENCKISYVNVNNRPAVFSVSFADFSLTNCVFNDIDNTIAIAKSCRVKINNIDYDVNKGAFDVAFFECVNCLKFTLNNSRFYNAYSTKTGGIVRIIGKASREQLSKNLIVVGNCTFQNNNAEHGGAIYVFNERITISNTVFSKNKANKNGGALCLNSYYDEDLAYTFPWILSGNSFVENSAELSGGAVFWQVVEPTNLKLNEFKSNTAQHGQNIASDPYFLIPEESSGTKFVSGQASNSNISIVLVDAYFQPMRYISTGYATLFWVEYTAAKSSKEIRGMFGQLTTDAVKGEFNFSEITLIATPKTNSTLGVKSDLIPRMNPHIKNISANTTLLDKKFNFSKLNFNHSQNADTKNYELDLDLEFRECVKGEIYNLEQNICERCPSGQFSLSPSDKICQDCPIQAVCLGGDQITINPGFWRSSTQSLKFYDCNKQQESCIGGNTSFLCKKGYQGPLCESCSFNEAERYFKIDGISCEQCEAANSSVLLYFVLLFVFLLLILNLFLIKSSVSAMHKTHEAVIAGLKTYEEAIKQRAMVKIFTLTSNVKVKWPDIFVSWKNVSGMTSNFGSFTIPFDCTLADIGDKIGLPLFVMKILLAIVVAYVSLFAISITFMIYKIVKQLQSVRLEFISSIIITVFLFQPSLLNLMFSSLKCVNIDDAKYIADASNISCDDDFYNSKIMGLVIPNLIIWMVIAPLSLFYYLKKNEEKIYTTEQYFTCDFIINGYQKKYNYWEFINMFRKYIIILMTTFITNEYIAALTVFLVVNIFALYEIRIKPFMSTYLNKVSLSANISIFISYCSAIYFGTDITEGTKYVLLIAILISNLVFAFMWIKGFLPSLKGKLLNMVTASKTMSSMVGKIAGKDFIKKASEKQMKDAQVREREFQRGMTKKGHISSSSSEFEDNVNKGNEFQVKQNGFFKNS